MSVPLLLVAQTELFYHTSADYETLAKENIIILLLCGFRSSGTIIRAGKFSFLEIKKSLREGRLGYVEI